MNASGSKGFAVPYPNVTLHAVSRSDNGPSIYCQIDSNPDADLAAGGEDDGDIADLIELTIIPTDPNSGKHLHIPPPILLFIFISGGNLRSPIHLCISPPRSITTRR